MRYSAELGVALQAALEAARICQLARRRSGLGQWAKEDGSWVTVADLASQALIEQAIAEAFPDDRIIAEESFGALADGSGADVAGRVLQFLGDELGERGKQAYSIATAEPGRHSQSERCWLIDPLDGTSGYLGGRQYATAVALMEGSSVVVGVLCCPELPTPDGGNPGCVLATTRGRGTVWRSLFDGAEHLARVSSEAQPRIERIYQSVEQGHSSSDVVERLRRAFGSQASTLKMDSQCKYAEVACGRADGYVRFSGGQNYRECLWDHAAGAILLENAGGRVTDGAGRALIWEARQRFERSSGIVATNGHIHDQIIEVFNG